MTLQTQKLLVELADGRKLEAEARNPDYIRWELTAARERWPLIETDAAGNATVRAPILMTTFLAWAALNRTGQYEGKWEDFRSNDCLGVESLEAAEVDPTPPEPDTGSLSSSP